jgi:hypothetical protein
MLSRNFPNEQKFGYADEPNANTANLQGKKLLSFRDANVNIEMILCFTNLTFDKGPKVSWNNESEQDPRSESILSIFG